MTAKVKYNKKLLEQICERDKCIIDFDKIEKYNRDVRIEFICCCGNNCKKTLRCLYEGGGAHCQKCTEKLRQTKVKQTCIQKYGIENTLLQTENIRYSKELLEQICKRDKCIIDFNKIDKYNRDVRIEFICCCGNNCKKTLRCLYEGGGAHCQKCTEKLRQTKVKQKSLDKYGVEHFTQVKEIKDKVKQTCLNKYGVEYALQSQTIKDKVKQTCLNKYGVEYPTQSSVVKDKAKQTCLDKYGVEYASQSNDFKNRVKKTCLDKYGVEYAL